MTKTKKNNQIYPLSYLIEPGSFTKDQLKEKGLGGCDAIIIHSLLFPADGSRSELIISSDHRGDPLTDSELFKSWIMMAHQLSESMQLDANPRAICDAVFKSVQAAILKARRDNHDD